MYLAEKQIIDLEAIFEIIFCEIQIFKKNAKKHQKNNLKVCNIDQYFLDLNIKSE